MPPPSLHPLPNNPTTGQQPLASLTTSLNAGSERRGYHSGPPPASAAGGGGVSRDTMKGLQDVVWSDDEDDPDCLLCAEPLDLADLNFKPCQCGMQICQFCYNKLLSTDARCPGCRRTYDAKAVVFQPVDWEDVKKAKEKKTRRAKTIKQLTSMGRRNLLGVRVVMKNTVYVVGMKLPAPGEESIPILRSNDYFGQYGKISRLYLRDRTLLSSTSVHTLDPDNPSLSTGIYIIYVRREDAARAILALDGIPAPAGPPGQTLKASYGTTRYCDSFLRGMKCDTHNCQNLHEWGGESDCFTKEDMETAFTKPDVYDARQKQAQIAAPPLSQKSAWPRPSSAAEDISGLSALPNSAAWGKGVPIARATNRVTAAPIGSSRPSKAPTSAPTPLPLKSNAAFPLPTPSPVQPPPIKEKKEKKSSATAMARGKSTDSTQSGTTSSGQTSPKRKLSVLAPASAIKTTPITAPPGIPVSVPVQPTAETKAMSDQPDLSESISADSEAGPSLTSPPPQTPARGSDLPPSPLTAEPIFVHSPYEEPRLYSFPSSDPGFAFVLAVDETDSSQHIEYRPSPFSKTLVGLAELGVLAPELPDLLATPPIDHHYTSTFQPFDAVDEDLFGSNSEAGPSTSREVPPEPEQPRTTSRFDFARPSSRSTQGRGQSPFALTRRTTDERDPWRSGQLPHGRDDRHPLIAQLNPLAVGSGTYSSPGGSGGHDWLSSGGGDSPFSVRDAGRFGKASRDRDDFDPAIAAFPSSRLFDGTHHRDQDHFANPLAALQHQHQHPQSQSQSPLNSSHYPLHPQTQSPVAGHGYESRAAALFGQHRSGSPTPLAQGFRRF